MMTTDDLVGVWVDDNVGGLGPQILVLYPDGRAACDVYNVTFAGREEFRWKLTGSGSQLEFSQYVDDPTRPKNCHVVSLHLHGSQRVLRLESHVPDNKALGITGGHFITDYYLSSTSINDYVPPKEESA